MTSAPYGAGHRAARVPTTPPPITTIWAGWTLGPPLITKLARPRAEAGIVTPALAMVIISSANANSGLRLNHHVVASGTCSRKAAGVRPRFSCILIPTEAPSSIWNLQELCVTGRAAQTDTHTGKWRRLLNCRAGSKKLCPVSTCEMEVLQSFRCSPLLTIALFVSNNAMPPSVCL